MISSIYNTNISRPHYALMPKPGNIVCNHLWRNCNIRSIGYPLWDMKRIRVVGKGQKVRTIPISNILLNEIQDWLKYRAEMAKKKRHVKESAYVFYSQRSPKFSVRGIQTMIENYSSYCTSP